MLTGFKKNMGSAGSSGGADMAKGILGGIGPGILGIPVKSMLSKWAAGLTVGLAALPALAGVIGLGIGTALIGGAVAAAIKTSPALKAQFAVIGKDASSMFTNAAAPLIPAVSAVLKQVPALLKTIGPQLTDVFKAVAPQIQGIFSGLKPIISGVLGIMKAAAPAFGTLIEGLEKLVSGILPGIETVIKAAVPFAAQFAGILGTLGKDLGSFFADAAPAIGASMQVLGALLDLIGGLLPVVMKLAGVFATALAPVIGVFATAIKALTPFLTTLGVILAELAQAVLGDLGSAFTALAALLVGIAPSLNTLATALGSVFSTLENTGVFAEIGNAIEALAPPLAKLINALVQGLAPALPTIVSLLGKMAAVVTAGAVIILGGLASALTSIVKAVPSGVLQAIAIGLVAVFTAFKVGSLISSAATAIGGVAKAMLGLDASMDANPIGLVVLAIAALGTAFYIAWEKSAGFRNIMKDIAAGFLEYGQIIVEIDRDIVNAFLEVVANILSAAATAFGWVPGLGSKLREASTNFDNFKGHVNNTFNGMISTMQGWQSDLDTDTSKGAASLKTVEDAFDSQSRAAGDAKTALDNYTTSVTDNGVKSAAAQAARTQLITDLTDAGVKSSTAQTDVGNYTAAITQNGVSSTQAQAARQQLITDVLNASNNAKQGNTDLGNYTTAVRNNGTDSDAAKAARQQLITDLENAGMNAKTATGLVNDLGNGIKGLPGGKNINIDVTAQGTWTVTGLQALLGMNTSAGGLKPTPTGAASGGIVSGTGDGDNQLYLLESGEVIVPRKLRQTGFFSKVIAPWLKKMGVPGFAAGGVASTWVDNDYDSTEDNAATSMKSQFLAALKGASAAATSAAAAGSTKTGAGDMTYAQLEALWIQAGGSPAVASNMAKIAIAESGGNPNAYNASGATGLWQILGAVVSGNLYSPLVNAENAVSKYNAGGYAPWESDPVAAGLLGMAQGGMITEPVIGFGASGQRYMFGERGTETVTPGGGASIADVCARLERLIATTAAVPAGVGSHMGSAIGGAAAAASLRQRYPRGGS
jgi:phage-related protein